MSAIAGIFFLDSRPVDRLVMERMMKSVAHRGPDGAGMWSEGPVGLGHQMLWTTPESLHENLPLVNKSGHLVLTVDARIDNRDELISTLNISGRPREEIGDGELILAAYERWGERCPERLLGDFAFAIWDRWKQKVFCARDHMGVKPFYYYRSERVFVFGSEIKALLCVSDVPRRLNEVKVADYLVQTMEDKTSTFYREIYRLPPGHSMSVGVERASVWPYWLLDPTREVRFRSDAEYAEAFRDVFAQAVNCRLRSAFPVGSMLSGGLDSSSVVCMARDLLGKVRDRRLHTFSAIFPDVPESDERTFIDAVLAQGGLEAHSVRADLMSPMTDIERNLWHLDEVPFGLNYYINCGINAAAYRQGVRIVLSGLDGDTTVSHGTVYLTELACRGRWRTLAAEVRALSKRTTYSSQSILRKWAVRPLIPEPVRRARRALRRKGSEPPWATTDMNISPDLVRSDFARRVGLVERYLALEGRWLKPERSQRADHWRELITGIHATVLEEIDKLAAAFSVEARYPFYDKRLVEFCLALPPEQKLNRGWDRVIMRRAMAGSLPDEVRWRPDKSDLLPGINYGMLKYGRGLVEEVIVDDPGPIEDYVDLTTLREMYHRYACRDEKKDNWLAILTSTTLALWLRQTGLSP